MASTFKIVLAVGGIFIAGAVTGGFAGWRAFDYVERTKRAQFLFGPNEMGGRLAAQLNLTPEQKQNIRPIIVNASDELRKARRESFNQAALIIGKMDAEMAKILTAAQAEQLKDIRAKEEERRNKRWAEERAKRNEQRPQGAKPEGDAPRPPGEMLPPPPARTP
jgi:Spy/CpxP family protein refolding chaperone